MSASDATDSLLGPIIGRSSETDAIRALFREGARLVTLHGPPGIGKTRLARHLSGTLDRPCDVLDLTTCRDADELLHAMAAHFELPGPGALDRAVARRLASMGDDVLVLDNFDQLVPAGVDHVAGWLLTSSIRLLVTSRRLLGLPCERSFELGPLQRERAGETPSDAAKLFLRTRSKSQQGFAPAGSEAVPAESVEKLVSRLEGNPLAIELAASRSLLFGVDDLASRLSEGLGVLDDEPNVAAHRSLRGAIASAWSTLAPEEQRAFAGCSVFRAPFRASDAEAVVATSPRTLSALRARSLVSARHVAGETRLLVYESLKEFGASRLDELGLRNEIERAHAMCFVSRAEAGGPPSDHPELLAAAERLVARGGAENDELAMRAIAVLVDWARSSRAGAAHAPGPLDRLCRDLLGRSADLAASDRVCLLSARARVALRQGATPRAIELWNQAWLEIRGAGDAAAAAVATELGSALAHGGCFEEARALLAQALAIHERLHAPEATASTLLRLAQCSLELGDHDEAQALLDRVRSLPGDAATRFLVPFYSGVSLHDRQQLPAASEQYAQARQIAIAQEQPLFAAYVDVVEGISAQELRSFTKAVDLFVRALPTLSDVDGRFVLLASGHLGACLAALGRADEASRAFDTGDRLRQHVELAGLRESFTLQRMTAALETTRDAPLRVRLADEAQAHLTALFAPGATATRSSDVRIAARILEQTIALERSLLVIQRDGDWFELPRGARISCRERAGPRNLLAVLARDRLSSPGVELTGEMLIQSAWPDERLIPKAARNRLHVALSTLRTLGLRELIISTAGGYMLDPAIPVRLSP